MNHRDQSAADRGLRLLTILAWIPAFALSLPHGLASGYPCPAVGILPMSFSACVGIFNLTKKAKLHGVNIAMDLFCALFLIGVLIASWIMLSWTDFSRHARTTMLGTYGTVPMMMNLQVAQDASKRSERVADGGIVLFTAGSSSGS